MIEIVNDFGGSNIDDQKLSNLQILTKWDSNMTNYIRYE